MRSIEKKISPFIENMFPSFYKEEGPNFIAFVKAYYEWLESNYQILELQDTTDFNVGDTVTQEGVTGTILAHDGVNTIILVDGYDTFKCQQVCSSLDPITSSSGGSTLITRGGTTRRTGTLFLARHLPEYRDIDKTIDIFIARFKEKYLKNIVFQTQTNEVLLVKHALDLYRSKGTSRSIDLFFRLIYGAKSSVYYPGDDLFKLSAAEWHKPYYLEVEVPSVDRAIALVGKQITGTSSGATAFVEKYIKRRINGALAHILYVSAIRGTFEKNELVKSGTAYSDSPVIVGSLAEATVTSGSYGFEVGDIVSIVSATGYGGQARVSSISSTLGIVEYELIDGGYGFTVNLDSAEPYSTTLSQTTDRIITLDHVDTGFQLDTLSVSAAGTGYDNTDIIVIESLYNNAAARPITNSTGGILSCVIQERGGGFHPDTANVTVIIYDSTGASPSGGSSANLQPSYLVPKQYFDYWDTLYQSNYYVLYANNVSESDIDVGAYIKVGAANNYGIITTKDANTSGTGEMTVTMFNRATISNNDTIYLVSNNSITANAYFAVPNTATGKVIYVSNTATLTVNVISGTYGYNDVIYQLDSANNRTAQATISNTNNLVSLDTIEVSDLQGVFQYDRSIYVEGQTANAWLIDTTLDCGVVLSNGDFTSLYYTPVYSRNGTEGNTNLVSTGSGASFEIATLDNTETILLNTDVLTNTAILNTLLNAVQFGFPGNPSANISSNIYNPLTFESFTIGSIETLGNINPGSGYNVDPKTSIIQPYITGFYRRDYIFKVENVTGQFVVGEQLQQTVDVERSLLYVANASLYEIGERVHCSNGTVSYTANGTVSYLHANSNYIYLVNLQGTVPNSTTVNVYSFATGSNSAIVNSAFSNTTTTAKTIVESLPGNNVVYTKRIQFDNIFDLQQSVTGSRSGATANIVYIDTNTDSDPIGFNAQVDTTTATANGTVESLTVFDSGAGFKNNQQVTFTSEDGSRSGTAIATLAGMGTGAGSYKSNKGFLSETAKLHDGDYYQEYSYDVLSRIPLEKYGEMFKTVMHTAGTRFFGSVVIDSNIPHGIDVANTTVVIS